MKKFNLKKQAECAVLAAILCIAAPMAVQIGPVPISLATFVIMLAGVILPPVQAAAAVLIYILLGCFGLPVFSGARGGVQILFSSTGGYIMPYVFYALVISLVCRKRCNSEMKNVLIAVLGCVLGTVVCYLFGTAWFVKLSGSDVAYAMGVCVLPFLPLDAVKIVLASVAGTAVRTRLEKLN